MEPISIFGLAVNVLQLIDFSAKLLREAHELHHSSTGNKQQHVELQVIADDLSRLCDDVASQQDGSNAGMQGIATAAKGVADDLVAAIEKLKLKEPRTRWRSFRQALSTLWNSATINALQHRLKEIRDQMQTNMVSQIKSVMSSVLSPAHASILPLQRVLGAYVLPWSQLPSPFKLETV
jgi:hypothetical protein